MNRILFNSLTGIALFLLPATSFSETFNAKRGDIWMGGNLLFSSTGGSNERDRLNMLQLSPTFRIFPISYLYVGPKFSWTGIFIDEEAFNMMNLGGEIGCAFGGTIIPYLQTAPHASIAFDARSSEEMFYLPFTAGLIAPVADNLGIQFELGISVSFYKGNTYNTFSIGFGVCGLGEKLAISMMNGISSITSDLSFLNYKEVNKIHPGSE